MFAKVSLLVSRDERVNNIISNRLKGSMYTGGGIAVSRETQFNILKLFRGISSLILNANI